MLCSKVEEQVALRLERRVLEERRKQLDRPFLRLKRYTLSDFIYEAVMEKLAREES